MASGKHIGKVVLKIRDEESQKKIMPKPKPVPALPRTYMNPEKSYILAGQFDCSNLIITVGSEVLFEI